jgi:hypothetical protein
MKAKTLFVIFLVFVIFSSTVFGTAQSPDIVIYKGEEYRLLNNPLENYFQQYPDKRPKGGTISSANWRGYVAKFEIIEDLLYLVEIEILVEYTENEEKAYKFVNVLNEVFPDEDFIKIDWVSGLLVLPYGEIVDYVHMGYASLYEHYILLEMDNGILKNETQLNSREYKKYREKQFQVYKKTEEYEKKKSEIRRYGGNSESNIESFLRIFEIDYMTIILKK